MKESNITRELIYLILDSFSREKNAAIGLFKEDGNTVFAPDANSFFSPLCKALYSIKMTKVRCERDHRKRASAAGATPNIEICHAGLFNIAEPILINGVKKATILCGQKKVCDSRDLQNKSTETFDRFLRSTTLSEGSKIRLRRAYERVGTITVSELEDLGKRVSDAANLIYQVALEQELLDDERTNLQKRIDNVAHEIQIYNQGAIASAERLLFDMRNGTISMNLGEKVVGQLTHLGTTVDNMIWSEHHFKQFDSQPVDVISLIDQSVTAYEWYAMAKGVKIIHKKDNLDRCMVTGSAMLLQNLFNNLVHNAVKYSFRGSKEKLRVVEVETTMLETYVLIKIKNYGIGILREELGRIWEPGARGELTRDEHRTGSGLGLKISKETVDRHNGRITAKSYLTEGEANLNVFSVALPLSD